MRDNFLFKWNKSQARGTIFLFLLIILLWCVYFFVNLQPRSVYSYTEKQEYQKIIDSLVKNKNNYKIYPFNPNFISDYKAYKLGITTKQLQKLNNYRSKGNWINSAFDFQKVTGISDSLLNVIRPYFKFPSWVKNRNANKCKSYKYNKTVTDKKDINNATAQDLKEVYGIGEKLSQRIISYREKINGFSIKEQMNEVWGLEKEVISRLWDSFDIKTKPNIEKIDLNKTDLEELRKLPYLNYKQARDILILRTRLGDINKLDDLLQVDGIDKYKLKILELYLSVNNTDK